MLARYNRILDVSREDLQAVLAETQMRQHERRLAQTLCADIMAHPGSLRPLADRAQDIGASARTLIRLFPKETGLHYRQWVQQVHLAHAFEMLARGASVGSIAATLGYASPSAFTGMFRRLLGRTPQHYLAEWRAQGTRS